MIFIQEYTRVHYNFSICNIYKFSIFFSISGKGGGSEVSGVDQGATTRSAKSTGLFPAEACRKSALRGHPRFGHILCRPQVRASQ